MTVTGLAGAATFLGEEGSAGGVLKDLADALVGLRGTLEVLVCADLLADLITLDSVSLAYDDDGRLQSRSALEASIPALWKPASGWSCGAPQWSSGRDGDPSCSRRE